MSEFSNFLEFTEILKNDQYFLVKLMIYCENMIKSALFNCLIFPGSLAHGSVLNMTFKISDRFTESLEKINEFLVFQWLSGSHPLQLSIPLYFVWFIFSRGYPANTYLLKVNNENTRKRWEIC